MPKRCGLYGKKKDVEQHDVHFTITSEINKIGPKYYSRVMSNPILEIFMWTLDVCKYVTKQYLS